MIPFTCMRKSYLNYVKNVFAPVSEMSRDEISNGNSVETAQPFFLCISFALLPWPLFSGCNSSFSCNIDTYPDKWIFFQADLAQWKESFFSRSPSQSEPQKLARIFQRRFTVTVFLALAWEPMVCWMRLLIQQSLSCKYQEYPGVKFVKPWGSPVCYWLRLWKVERGGWLLYPGGRGPVVCCLAGGRIDTWCVPWVVLL